MLSIVPGMTGELWSSVGSAIRPVAGLGRIRPLDEINANDWIEWIADVRRPVRAVREGAEQPRQIPMPAATLMRAATSESPADWMDLQRVWEHDGYGSN
jgi:hypothetical protein